MLWWRYFQKKKIIGEAERGKEKNEANWERKHTAGSFCSNSQKYILKNMNDTKVPTDSFVKATRSQKKGAKEILRLGRKVYDFRKDLLEDVDARNLDVANDELERSCLLYTSDAADE